MKILVTSKTEHMERLAKRWLVEWDQKMNQTTRKRLGSVLEVVNEYSPKNNQQINKQELGKEISEIISILKSEKKDHLARCIEENWQKNVLNYSKELNSWKPSKPLEPELLSAFKKELERLDTTEIQKNKILNSIEKRRVIQTAPHLVATEGPRMLTINWLGSLGVSKDDFYTVAMFSGVPFSNSFRPGRINRKDSSVNLFQSSMQDGLVYRSIIQNKLIEAEKDIPPQIKKFLPNAKFGESYTKWALKTCQNIERDVLKKDNLVFLDINEVVSNYLSQVLKNKNHILYKIFFDIKTREKFMEAFPDEIMFYDSIMDGKYEKMENITFSANGLSAKNKKIPLDNPKTLIAELEEGRLCPALIVSFLSLAFLNQFKCFGSFAQVEYLPEYQEKLAKLKFMKEFDVEKVPTANLTTGTLGGSMNVFPVDVIMGEEFKPKEEILFGEILLPMKERLINGRKSKNDLPKKSK